MMAPSPTQTKAWHRKKGWFTEREEKILVNRILRDDPSKGDMHNRQAITFKLLWKSITDFDLWPLYIVGLTFGMVAGPPDQYLTLNLRRMGFDTFDSNLLSIPNNVIGAFTVRIETPKIAFSKSPTNFYTDVNIDLLLRNLQPESSDGPYFPTLGPPMYNRTRLDPSNNKPMGTVRARNSSALMAES